MEFFQQPSFDLLTRYAIPFILSLLVIILYYIIQRKVIPKFETYVDQGELHNDALKKAVSTFRLLYGVVSFSIILFIWGFDFQWLLAVSSGLITLTGVALFASWSILSNITAFFILLAHESYKRGNFIRIIEADNYVEGTISEINLFNTRLITENMESIIYPNNLLIARPTIINPNIRFTTIGKIQEFLASDTPAEKLESKS
jgi:small-conductance mechanosensitive channel